MTLADLLKKRNRLIETRDAALEQFKTYSQEVALCDAIIEKLCSPALLQSLREYDRYDHAVAGQA